MNDATVKKALLQARRMLIDEKLTSYGDNDKAGIIVYPGVSGIERHNQVGSAIAGLASAILISNALERKK